MTYKKALELKKAGFPQNKKNPQGYWQCLCDDKCFDKENYKHKCKDEDYTYFPTLSELIDACLKQHCVFRLYCWEHGFVIGFQPEEKKDDMEICEDPKTAVTNLYIALNKK